MPQWEVTANESGARLSAFLKSRLASTLSGKQIKLAIEHNACSINGTIERFSSRIIGKGDVVAFQCRELSTHAKTADILYEDAHVLACNKPAGISSEDPSLAPAPGLILVHRLDKDTTGVLLWAKHQKAADLLMQAFKKRTIAKTYLAIADGTPKERSGHISNYLARRHVSRGQSLWGVAKPSSGLEAITSWQVERAFSQAALIVCRPETGRTHQIRVHLSGLGHPILGDRQYGRHFACPYRPSRCLLHAQKIAFQHPIEQIPVEIIAPLPHDFYEVIQALGKKQ